MKASQRVVSLVICLFFVVFTLGLPSHYCYSYSDSKTFDECLKEFKADLEKLKKANDSFLKRHFWKITGTCISVVIIIVGVVIFFSLGSATPVALPAGAVACMVVGGGSVLTAWVLGILSIATPFLAGYLVDQVKKSRHGIKDETQTEIYSKILEQKVAIMQSAKTKEDIYNRMNLIATEIIKKQNSM